MLYVYILRSKIDGKLYIGFTEDLRKRIITHNLKVVKSTKPRAPLELIYYEAYKNREDALRREKLFKTGWGRQYIYKNLNNYFSSKKDSKT